MDIILYLFIGVISVVITKYAVPFTLVTTEIPRKIVPIVNLLLNLGIFSGSFLILLYISGFIPVFPSTSLIPSPPATSAPASTTAELTNTPTVTPQPALTWTPTSTPRPASTWTPTSTPASTATEAPMQKVDEPTWTPTRTPASAPTWTPTRTPVPAPTWTPTNTPTRQPDQPTRTPMPQLTPTVPSDMGMIILEGSSNLAGLGTQVQWVDGSGRWNNVENWYGPLDDTGRISWLVWSKDFNTGPFRWVVYNRDGSTRFESQSFYLPSASQSYLVSIY